MIFLQQFVSKFGGLQALLKLRHESNVEHIFVVGNSGKQFEIVLVKYLFFHRLSIILGFMTD